MSVGFDGYLIKEPGAFRLVFDAFFNEEWQALYRIRNKENKKLGHSVLSFEHVLLKHIRHGTELEREQQTTRPLRLVFKHF